MAGRGAAPKRPDERHRRAGQGHVDELPAEGYQGDFPKLPATYNQRTWDGEKHVTTRVRFLPGTRDWYEDWAHSPMAIEFIKVHWRRLQSLAKLQDRFDRGDMTVTAELRQGLAAFGGTPLDVRRLGRSIGQPTAPSSGRGAAGGADSRSSAARGGRRGRLEAVPDPE